MTNQNPEQIARDHIDKQLLDCGWLIQDKSKTEKPPDNRIWFDTHHLHVDLDFLGIIKNYPAG